MSAGAGDGRQGQARIVDIIQFNDVYNLDPTTEENPIGGAARFATVLARLRATLGKKGRTPLLVFCGDFVGPSLMSSVTHGAHLIEAFNKLNVDFGTFGNHEFDYGYQSLMHRLRGVDDDVEDAAFGGVVDYPKTQTKWLMTNLTEAETGLPVGGEFATKTALIRHGPAGVRVGLLAVSENWITECTQLKPNEIVYEDYIEAARTAAAKLRAEGAELVVALCHNRLDGDRVLAKEVPAIDIILGGHDHFYKRDDMQRVIKSGEEWRWLTHVRVDLMSTGPHEVTVERHDVDDDIEPNKEILGLCEKYKALADQKFKKPIAHTKVALDPRESVVRFMEGTLPNFFCDACAEDYSEAEGLQSADFALLNGYTFSGKEEIPAGSFTLGNLMSVLPRPATLVVVKLTGADVVATLSVGVKKLPEECGSLFHVSERLKYTVFIHGVQDFDAVKGVIPKPDVRDVLVDGQPIQLDKLYTVAVSDATATGKFGLPWMKTALRIVHEENAHPIADVVHWYCSARVADRTRDISPVMGRITIVHG